MTRLLLLAALCCVLLSPGDGSARVLEVGPQHGLKSLGAAAAAARDGDVIQIEPGDYADCAVWRANQLTITGKGDGVVITTKTCQGKGLFVITGRDVTVRNLTFTGARVPDANGAGIRAEGRNLTVEHSRFLDNENGILAASDPQSTIRIIASEFAGNGSCEKDCAHGVYINGVGLLRIERSRFLANRFGHHIKSRALTTELIGNEILDGDTGTSSYLVDIPNGGRVLMDGNVLEKGRLSHNPATAISIGAEGVKYPTPEIRIVKNRLFSRLSGSTVFVRNLTAVDAVLMENQLVGKIMPLVGKGSIKYRYGNSRRGRG
jgi:nitrous oxidase accessory protein NosD